MVCEVTALRSELRRYCCMHGGTRLQLSLHGGDGAPATAADSKGRRRHAAECGKASGSGRQRDVCLQRIAQLLRTAAAEGRISQSVDEQLAAGERSRHNDASAERGGCHHSACTATDRQLWARMRDRAKAHQQHRPHSSAPGAQLSRHPPVTPSPIVATCLGTGSSLDSASSCSWPPESPAACCMDQSAKPPRIHSIWLCAFHRSQ